MVVEKFLNYVSIDTQSDPNSTTFPSTQKQKDLAKCLYQELKGMGASHCVYDDVYGYVYAKLPATDHGRCKKTLAFIAHMDTSSDASGANIHPRIIKNYDGEDILLNEALNIISSPTNYPELKNYIGKTLIVTDGTTLLGGDDKAGIAEIMTMAQYFLDHPEVEHGPISIAFTPDEEVGSGVDHIDLNELNADFAFTVDGGALGELEYENFNAASAKVDIHGIVVHPGSSKDKMINAVSIATQFDQMLPEKERPQHTEGYEGFYHLMHLEGSVEHASMEYIIRDHDMDKFNSRKAMLEAAASYLNLQYGKHTVELSISDSYFNMKDQIIPEYSFLIDAAKESMINVNMTPNLVPVRGGTDGARLSFMGLPCPNICTGGHNFHGRFEFICIESMENIVELLIDLSKNIYKYI